jgi:hypothetical protein
MSTRFLACENSIRNATSLKLKNEDKSCLNRNLKSKEDYRIARDYDHGNAQNFFDDINLKRHFRRRQNFYSWNRIGFWGNTYVFCIENNSYRETSVPDDYSKIKVASFLTRD